MGRPTIVVIEDDEAYSYVLSKELEGAGFDTVCFTRANPFLDYIDRGGPVDAMVIDVQLPPGTPHGLSVAFMARSRRPQLAIVLASSHPYQTDLADGIPVLDKSSGAKTILDRLLTQGLSNPS